MMQEMQFIKD